MTFRPFRVHYTGPVRELRTACGTPNTAVQTACYRLIADPSYSSAQIFYEDMPFAFMSTDLQGRISFKVY